MKIYKAKDSAVSVFTFAAQEQKIMKNIEVLLKLANYSPFLIKTQKADREQAKDLLNFSSIGEEEFYTRISYHILKIPSVQAPRQRKKLKTVLCMLTDRQRIIRWRKINS